MPSAITLGAVNLASSAGVTGILPAANGGTGVNNSTRTLTIGSNAGTLTFSSAALNLTIPATGTAALGTGAANKVAVWTATNVIGVDSALYTLGAGALQFTEMAVPANPAANDVKVFAFDNGGITEWLSLYNNGNVGGFRDDGTIKLYGTANTATTASAGAQTLPANPVGFLLIMLNGTLRKIPYYAT